MAEVPPEGTENGRQLGKWRVSLILAMCAGILGRVLRGYRSFPQRDDFAYVPIAWNRLDPDLYPADFAMQPPMHIGAFIRIVQALEGSIGLPGGLYVLTISVSILTMWAVWHLLRSCGSEGWAAPLVGAVLISGRVFGVGRSRYDGAFDDAFHMQWVALCFLMFAYSELIRRRPRFVGLWLGLTAIAHPVVAANGAIVVACCSFAPTMQWLKDLCAAAIVSIFVSSPIVIPLGLSIVSSLHSATDSAWPARRLIEDGYLFRGWEAYQFSLPTSDLILLGLFLLAGVLATFARGVFEDSRRVTLRRLLSVHVWLIAAVPVVYGVLQHGITWVYTFDITRVSPMAILLSAVALSAVLEKRLVTAVSMRGLAVAGICGIPLLAFVASPWWLLAVSATVAVRRLADSVPRLISGALVLFFLLGCGWCTYRARLEAEVAPAEVTLFEWARTTSKDAQFVVPPGFKHFRYYSRRGIYVDFHTSRIGDPPTLPEWRRRLDLVSGPLPEEDRADRGWLSCITRDRAYGANNGPARIRVLLESTGCDYLVYDRTFPSFDPAVRNHFPAGEGDESQVDRVFENQRFIVFRLTGDADEPQAVGG